MHSSTFEYLKPSKEQLAEMAFMRKAYADLYEELNKTPNGEYKVLAIRALEESAMWCNKGITRHSNGTPRDGATVG